MYKRQVIGKFLTQLGQLFITTAIAMLAFNVGLKSMNPILMLGAGVALVAAGSLVSSFASKGISGGSGGGGGSSAASGYSYSGGSSAMQNVNVGGEFVLRGTTLVASASNVDRRNSNIR